jgi:pyridoxal phosphate enzyme (YggS family)
MSVVDNYNYIINSIQSLSKKATLIVVTKNRNLDVIKLLIKENHFHFGENKVQESLSKWQKLILTSPEIKLHLIGKLQSNKAKDAFKIFHYIHTLDNEKLAKIFEKLENNSSKKIKYFVQVNIANEPQKNGISFDQANQFIKYCVNDLKLNVIGLMCIPPIEGNPDQHFKNLAELARANNLSELSMGMSNDYEIAIKNGATFVRVGSKIFSEN